LERNALTRALIIGAAGQHGAYLPVFLVEKGYEVHGVERRSLLINTSPMGRLWKISARPTAG
jgi:GDPmannose 4,6-dehydratase